MKKLTLVLTLLIVVFFVVLCMANGQTGTTTTPTDTTKKEVAKQETATKDTTKAATKDTTKAAAKDTTKAATKVVSKYIGTAKCKMCHNSEAKGKIWDQWSAEGHAKAYQTLLNEQSKGIAKGMGIADASKSEKCLKCHVAGYGQPNGDKYSVEEGVTCESCHGPGENYWKMQIMKDKKLAMANGLVEPTEALCLKCHNKESPTYKAFKYADMIKLVQHKVGPATPGTQKK